MDINKAREFCSKLRGVTSDTKWGSDLVFSIGEKMFAVTCLKEDEFTGLSFKVDEDRFLELTDRAGIIPAPYLARAKWIQITDPDVVSDLEVQELLPRSYALVLSKLTKKLQKELAHE